MWPRARGWCACGCRMSPGRGGGPRRCRRVTATFASVVALMDHLVCQGVERLVLESTSDYWRIWYYLAEAAGLEVQLASARDVGHLPGRAQNGPPGGVWGGARGG